MTSDRNYILSGSADKTIRIWNLLEKRQVNVLDFEYPITSLEVDNEYNFTYSLNNGERKTNNLKEFI